MRCVDLRLCCATRRVLTIAFATAFPPNGERRQHRRAIVAGSAIVVLTLLSAVPVYGQSTPLGTAPSSQPVRNPSGVPEESLTLEDLIRLPEKDLAKVDVVTLNLAAAEGLPGSERIDRKAIRDTIDGWARRVAAVTLSKAHFFKSNPDYYENSWAKFCAIQLVLTLQQDLGVHYNYEQRTNPSLAKSKDQFLHGIVEGTGGTCASLPVAFVAVGRRLGYPLRLAQSFSHFYARWDDPVSGERFNIEGSNPGGVDFHNEEHYREKAQQMGAGRLEGGNYFKSMSPREELSSFLTTRADCLRENGHWVEALHTYRRAARLAPENLFAAGLLRMTASVVSRMNAVDDLEAIYQRHEQRRRTDPRLMIPGLPAAPSATGVSVRPPVVYDPMPVIPRSPTGPSFPGDRFPAGANAWRPVDWRSLNVRAAEPPIGATQRPSGHDVFEKMRRRNDMHSPSGDWP